MQTHIEKDTAVTTGSTQEIQWTEDALDTICISRKLIYIQNKIFFRVLFLFLESEPGQGTQHRSVPAFQVLF